MIYFEKSSSTPEISVNANTYRFIYLSSADNKLLFVPCIAWRDKAFVLPRSFVGIICEGEPRYYTDTIKSPLPLKLLAFFSEGAWHEA
jgi:hypothetical protein